MKLIRKDEEMDLNNQHALVTGSTSGIGFALAELLAQRNCTVFLTGRSLKKCETCRDLILANVERQSQGEVKPTIFVCAADLGDASGESVERLVQFVRSKTSRLDLLYLNAGMIYTSTDWKRPLFLEENSKERLDLLYQTNCHNQIHLVMQLLDILEPPKQKESFSSSYGRVMATSSSMLYAGSRDYITAVLDGSKFSCSPIDAMKAYGNSKLALSLLCTELAAVCQNAQKKIYVRSFIPGMVATSLKVDQKRRQVMTPISTPTQLPLLGGSHRFSARQAAEYLLEATFVEPCPAQQIEVSSPLDISHVTLCPYQFPVIASVGLGTNEGPVRSTIRGAAFWLSEAFQKLWTRTSSGSTDSATCSRLFIWPDHPLTKERKFTELCWNKTFTTSPSTKS